MKFGKGLLDLASGNYNRKPAGEEETEEERLERERKERLKLRENYQKTISEQAVMRLRDKK